MILAVIASEIMIIGAITEYIKAHFYARQMPNLKAEGWTLTHIRFAEAGGFIYRTRDWETKIDNMRHPTKLTQSRKLGEPPSRQRS